jgi:hypothetical protein
MGSWNKTCGLSGLYITHSTPVYVIPLVEGTDKTDRCYTTSFWNPVLLPFNSIYNDYGGGEGSMGIAFDTVIKNIAHNLIEMPVGANTNHDLPVSRDGFGEKQFFESVHENRLFTHGWGGSNRHIDFVMFRKDIVDYICSTFTLSKYLGDGLGNGGHSNAYQIYTLADIINDIPEVVDAYHVKLSGVDERLAFHFNMHTLARSCINPQNLFSRAIQGVDSHRFSSIVDMNGEVAALLKTDRRDDAIDLLSVFALGYILNSFLDSVRKLWMPGGHEGSQSQDHDGYRLLNIATTNVLDDIDKEYAENVD